MFMYQLLYRLSYPGDFFINKTKPLINQQLTYKIIYAEPKSKSFFYPALPKGASEGFVSTSFGVENRVNYGGGDGEYSTDKFAPVSAAGLSEGKADSPKAIAYAKKEWEKKGVESSFFKRWFKGSKVVDGEGKPLVVWHGVRSVDRFTTFRNGKIFFTDNESVARMFNEEYRYKLIVDGKEFSVSERTAEDGDGGRKLY